MDGTIAGGWSGSRPELEPSAHLDPFPRDNLPPRDQWPEFRFDLPELRYPPRLNCATELLDRNIERGRGDHPAIVTPAETLTYRQLAERVDRLANVLVHRLGLVPGNRVLLRGANNAWMVAAYFAVLKAGGVVVATMPLLRAKELGQMLRKARVSHALCDARLAEELRRADAPDLRHLVCWGDGALEAMVAEAAPGFAACDTAAEDICLIGFTSGSTGEPKGTLHFHRDMLAICDGYGMQVLRPEPSDVSSDRRRWPSPSASAGWCCSPSASAPRRCCWNARRRGPAGRHRPAPRDGLLHRADGLPRHGRAGGAARHVIPAQMRLGRGALPKPSSRRGRPATGLKLMDGIGATEMLHIFIAAPRTASAPARPACPCPATGAKVVDEAGQEVPRGTPGGLPCRGRPAAATSPIPARPPMSSTGWNITGDTYCQDEDGYFWYQARNDDMIISAGYNIAGPEVEVALLTHPAVKECGVVGAPDGDRGMVVRAYVVLHPGHLPDGRLAKALQDHVKREIAPYKYPRSVVFVDALPRTETGKLQRFALRQQAQQDTAA
jgi:2-aminobenzoate-CoA ligase